MTRPLRLTRRKVALGMFATGGICVGRNSGSAVSLSYRAPFAFTGGTAIALPGDQTGLAAALVIAAGPPRAGQHRSAGPARCGGDPEARNIQHYVEALGATAGTGRRHVARELPCDAGAAEDADAQRWGTGHGGGGVRCSGRHRSPCTRR